jgi:zinc protease
VRAALAVLLLATACARPELPPPVQPLVSTPPDPSRAAPPAEEGGLAPLALPEVHSRRLSNGLTVYVVERHALPLVELRYVSRRAGHYNRDAAHGIGRLTAAVLGEEARANVVAIGAEHAQIALIEPSGGFDTALRELARTVQSPVLDPAAIARLRDDAVRASDSRLLNYSVRARALRRLFGEEHPASVPAIGRTAQLRDVERDDVVLFHRARYVPADSALVIVGDVERERAFARAEAELGAWQMTAPLPERPAPPRRLVMRHELHVYHWRSPQARITVAQYAPRIGSDDRLAFTVLGLILAGPSTARIGHELRSEQGVTYGVISDLDLRRDHGVWWIETAVGWRHLVPSLQRIAAALRRATEEPVGADELAIATRLYRESVAAQLETSGGVADLLVSEFVHGTPLAAYADVDRRLAALTPAELLRVAREYLQPLGPFIAAGDLNELDWRLRAGDVGEILLILPDDRIRRL